MVYAIPVKYMKKYASGMTALQKQYYATLYQLGLRRKEIYPNYYAIKENLKQMKRMGRKIELIREYGIYDQDTAQAAVEKLEHRIQGLLEERKEIYTERKPYQELLEAAQAQKKYEAGYQAFLNGHQEERENYQEYLNCGKKLEKYGFGKEEIKLFEKSINEKLKELYWKKKEMQSDLDDLKTIRSELKQDKNLIEDLQQMEDERQGEKEGKNIFGVQKQERKK